MDPDLVTLLDRRFAESEHRQSQDLHQALASQSQDLHQALASQSQDLHRALASQSQDLHLALAAQSAELGKEMAQLGNEMALQSEVDRQFRELHVLIEGLQTKIETVAEGVSANHDASQRLSTKMDRQFEELKSMFRLSYGPGAPPLRPRG